MRVIKNLDEANAALAAFVPSNQSNGPYKLDRMKQLMGFLGNPQEKFKSVHVAGTSGKTSTSYYAAALLIAAGYKVGLTVSPHVVDVRERVQINLDPLPETKFCAELSEFLALIEKNGIKPTYFELLVALAFWQFAKQQVDYAVIEVGLGGLLDGTNVIHRQDKVCIITDIGLDHINVLGTTLPEIALQKAGIIQLGNIVFCHQQAAEIINVFREQALRQKTELHVLKPKTSEYRFLPIFQQRNFSLAQASVQFILERDGQKLLSNAQINQAAKILVPARMEIIEHADKTIVMDGAHNAQKLEALYQSLKAKFPGQPIAALVSFVDGRGFRIQSSLQELAKITDSVIITAFKKAAQDLPYGPIEPKHLAGLARQHSFKSLEVIANPHQAYQKLLTRPEPILLITGSFYLMDDLRPEVTES